MAEQYNFTSDINSLMSLIINTFYTTRDCFLRELISNASDAIDKVRHQSLTDESALKSEQELRIRLVADAEKKTLTIWDTGVGMTKADLINKLSCIAHSGTKEFLEAVQSSQSDDVNLIGQFGVGFFSAYLVATTVEVVSKNDDDECLRWVSSAAGGFTIEAIEDAELTRGSKVILHLRDDMHEYLEETKIRELVTKHSAFVSYPIELFTTVTEEVEEEVAEAAEKAADEDEDAVVDVDEEAEEAEKKTTERTVEKWDRLNKQEAIWVRPKEDITEEEYNEFYRSISNDYQDALAWRHVAFEGSVTFKSIIYVPKMAPFSMFNQDKDNKRRNIKLHVRRVFITDDCEDLVPEWLSFVRGVVDADDLPLNISREMLQKNRVLKTIRKQIIKQSLELFNEIAQDEEQFKTFYEAFGQQIKLGVHESSSDETTRNKLSKLLRFYSSRSSTETTSFDDYVSAMKDGQKSIYYITGETRESIENSPFIEGLVKRGFEVLFLTEPIDEYCFNALKEVKIGDETYKLVCATKEDVELDLTEEEQKAFDEKKAAMTDLAAFMKETLGEKVEKVEISSRIVDSPCVIATTEHGWSASMERIVRAQALADRTMMKYMSSKKVLEINPDHPIVVSLNEKFVADKQDPTVAETVGLLYETCLIVSGFNIEKPVDYAGRIYRIVAAGLGTEIAPAAAVEAAADAEEAAEEDFENLSELDEVD